MVVIGVHAPEFAFERNPDNVKKAVKDLQIGYPVAIDNDYAIWRAFHNEYWPAHYFIDANGQTRHHHFGEGDYAESEHVIQQLLAEAGRTDVSIGVVAVSASGAQAAADMQDVQSPETYVGTARVERFASPGGAAEGVPQVYTAGALALNEWGLVGNWTVDGEHATLNDVIDPSTAEAFTQIALGGLADVDRAVAAAKAAFSAFSLTTRQERLDLLGNILVEYEKRRRDLAEVLAQEMGAPVRFAYKRQSARGSEHLGEIIRVLESYRFEDMEGATLIAREAIGVVGLITPWNWPINQIVCKVAPTIAAGCTMVLKPSEIAPLNAVIWSEVMHAAGVPKGVYNMLQGEGAVVGAAMSAHPDVAMMSFTGSTRAGILVAHDTPIEEMLEALHDVVKAGKARYIGASSMYARQFAQALAIAQFRRWLRLSPQSEETIDGNATQRRRIRTIQGRWRRHDQPAGLRRNAYHWPGHLG